MGKIITPQKNQRIPEAQNAKRAVSPLGADCPSERHLGMYGWATEVRPRGFTDPSWPAGQLTYLLIYHNNGRDATLIFQVLAPRAEMREISGSLRL